MMLTLLSLCFEGGGGNSNACRLQIPFTTLSGWVQATSCVIPNHTLEYEYEVPIATCWARSVAEIFMFLKLN